MRTDTITLDRLGRQRTLIDTVASRIEERARNGEPVELSLSLLHQERRLYRRMLGQAPLHVLDEHASAACFT